MLLSFQRSTFRLKVWSPNNLRRFSKVQSCRRFCYESAGKNSDIAVEKDVNNSSIQPDIKEAVSSTLAGFRKKQSKDILTVPKLRNTLYIENHPDIGQPAPYTHPHLFDSIDEVTPGLTYKEYAERREKLMILLSKSSFGRSHESHVVIIAGNSLKIMSNDIPYPFHQDTDFLYLTGLNQPDAVLAIEYSTVSDQLKYILFVKPKDPRKELWDGPVVGVELAKEYFKCNEAFPLSSLRTILKERFGNGKHVIWLKKQDGCKNTSQISNIVNNNSFVKKGVFTIGHNLQMLRLIKSEKEIEIMKSSASIAVKAFMKVMRNSKPGLTESQLHALLEFECRVRGAQHLSFPPVVAAGNRANTLHYINNTQLIKSGDMILMDGGCEFNGYASDITRTWPVDGKFTKEQGTIYSIVLEVQKICLKACKPGVSIDTLHKLMMASFEEKLQGLEILKTSNDAEPNGCIEATINFIFEIGIVNSSMSEMEVSQTVSKLCPHHLGHYLGMDTHDTPLIHRGLPLQPGMVFTMEPGLYLPENTMEIPPRYRGIGVRIEDNVVMTETGPYVLTAGLPKEMADIEDLMTS